MTARARRLLGAAILGLLGAPACAGARPPAAPAPMPAEAPGGTAPGGLSAAEFEAIFRARTDSARNRFTAADTRFMTHMIAHHAQALVMSALAPERAATSSVRVLAARIANAQQDEIDTMQRWLRDRGQPVPDLHAGHGGHGGHDQHLMPGMLTAAELAALENARGSAFDRLFLESMIRHHRGAVTMVEELFATDGAGQDEDVFRFASDVQVDQRTEIDRMERLLAAYPAGGGTP